MYGYLEWKLVAWNWYPIFDNETGEILKIPTEEKELTIHRCNLTDRGLFYDKTENVERVNPYFKFLNCFDNPELLNL